MKFVLLILSLLPVAAYAGTPSGDRNILNIGCHNTNTTCFVQISGASVGPGACSSTSIRWDVEGDANGMVALTHLTTAFIAGKMVSFQISDSCFANQSSYPTFDWWFVK